MKLCSSSRWNKVFFVKNRIQSLIKAALLRPKELYIDGDIGTRLALYLLMFRVLSGCKEIYVYEEGIGTYRNDIYPDGIKRKLFDFLCIATYFGGSWFCKGVYVYKPEKYIESHNLKKGFSVRKLPVLMWDYIEANYEYLCWLYDFDEASIPNGDAVELYLSSYAAERKILDEYNNTNKSHFVKLHPHLKVNEYYNEFPNLNFIGNSVPAELLIFKLSLNFEKVTVLHHGSSASVYMPNKNITYRII